jgi:hypothetical protein
MIADCSLEGVPLSNKGDAFGSTVGGGELNSFAKNWPMVESKSATELLGQWNGFGTTIANTKQRTAVGR